MTYVTIFPITKCFNGFRKEDDSDYRPNTDMFETKDEYVLKIELPGIKKEDIKITFEDNTLTVSGEKKKEENKSERLKYQEASFGKFKRSFSFSTGVDPDKGKADFRDGLLTIALPKKESVKTKEIEVEFN
jgi:HSP20 family protein